MSTGSETMGATTSTGHVAVAAVVDPAMPVTSVRQLVDYMAAGCKPDEASWRIGTEHEKFGFRLSDLRPLDYGGPQGIRRVLEAMQQRFGWLSVCEGGQPIALQRGRQAITLEPGGQLELSGAPLASIRETDVELHEHLREVGAVSHELGIGFLGIGMRPHGLLADMPWMPKRRYAIMRAYMPKRGRLGHEMMLRTCTMQVNLDFASEADMVQKLRVGLALQPIATALFANSPFSEGKPNGMQTLRSHIWTDTDPDRCGMLPFAFEPDMGFERYVDYALDVPMYFVRREGRYVDASGQSFRDFLAGRLPALPGAQPTIADFADHLTTIFPEVRLKHFLEMRGADASADVGTLCAVTAFWVGLLYDRVALDEAWQLVKDWRANEREALRQAVPRTALRTPFRGTTVHDLAREVLAIAARGLAAHAARARARARGDGEGDRDGGADDGGADDTNYLDPLHRIVDRGRTQADDLLDLFHGEWAENIAPVYHACRY